MAGALVVALGTLALAGRRAGEPLRRHASLGCALNPALEAELTDEVRAVLCALDSANCVSSFEVDVGLHAVRLSVRDESVSFDATSIADVVSELEWVSE